MSDLQIEQAYDLICQQALIKNLETYDTNDSRLHQTALFYKRQVKEKVAECLQLQAQNKNLKSEQLEQKYQLDELKAVYNQEYDLYKRKSNQQEENIKNLTKQLESQQRKTEQIVEEHSNALKQQQAIQNQIQVDQRNINAAHVAQIQSYLEQIEKFRVKQQKLQNQLDITKAELSNSQYIQQQGVIQQKKLVQQYEEEARDLVSQILISQSELQKNRKEKLDFIGIFRGVKINKQKLDNMRTLGTLVRIQYEQNQKRKPENRIIFLEQQLDAHHEQLAAKNATLKQVLTERAKFEKEAEYLSTKCAQYQQEIKQLQQNQQDLNHFHINKILEDKNREIISTIYYFNQI
ncbi:Hypothetical_protein [Hexamita inflata]|uniref:Hypothetical_protein n=1 Tax=Hexamita inflata TaxID=28002 RepID=A0AA86UY39_9EUKA|nr:Hypothetical protein HINF_LOCUS64275 [Hexamita inflata]